MPFDPKSAKKAAKKSKRGPAKKEEPSIKESCQRSKKNTSKNKTIPVF